MSYYCFFRSVWGTAKYLLFKAILDNGNTLVTIKEAQELVNKLRKMWVSSLLPTGQYMTFFIGIQNITRKGKKPELDTYCW
nr:hypothetical protein [uncultured Methanomethylovorans sp.]